MRSDLLGELRKARQFDMKGTTLEWKKKPRLETDTKLMAEVSVN